MNRRGLIVQLQRGIYLAPRTLPPGGKWMPSPAVVIRHLMEALDSKWQITGPVAFHHHGLTEQVPNLTAVYNTRLTGTKKIGSLEIEFIKVPEGHLGGIEKKADLAGGIMPTLARTIFDGVYDYSRFGSLPAAYNWLAEKRQQPDLLPELAKAAKEFGNVATHRRIGYCLQALGAENRLTKSLRKTLGPTQSVIPLVPGPSRKGKINRDWGIIENMPFPPND